MAVKWRQGAQIQSCSPQSTPEHDRQPSRSPRTTALYSKANWCWPANWKVHRPCGRLISSPQYWFQAFPFWQFHVLFYSLFKVLFIFPSRYLFAIGLSPVFSFRWYLPPILDSIPKLSDSLKTHHTGVGSGSKRDSHPLWCCFPTDLNPDYPRKRL